MYRTSGNFPIKKHEVVKKTAKQIVFINDRGLEQRESIESDWSAWHDNFEKAKEYLIEKQNDTITALKKRIESCEKRILEIEKM